MRIACVNQDPGIHPSRQKGAAVHLETMRRAFRQRGAEVAELDEPDQERLSSALDAELSSRGLDLIYERYALGCTTAARFARDRDIPYVLEVNAPLEEEEELWRGSRNAGSGETDLAFESAARVVAVSNQVAEYAIRRGAAPSVVHVMPNGVDAGVFRPRGSDDTLRRELVPEGRFALGFHGRPRPWHGLDRLAGVVADLLRRGMPLHLVLVGNEDLALPFDDPVMEGRISLVPWVAHDEVGRYVACFDALPLTHSPDAPFYFSPLKLAEAMACGVVPLVPDLGDLPSIVQDEQNGRVYPARRLDLLAEGICDLIIRPELTRRLARGAVSSASGWGWERIADLAMGAIGCKR